MIARIEFDYTSRPKFVDLSQSREMYSILRAMIPDAPDEERRSEQYAWPNEAVIELETDGRWLTEHGCEFKIKNFKGTVPLTAIAPGGAVHNVYVQVPHVGLLSIDEVEVCEDYCTDNLQRKLNEGWRIICVCPPNAARRPDYILGRMKEKS